MSDDRTDWQDSAPAQRREKFFTTTTAGGSIPSDPPRDFDLPERPRRRQTPHPRAERSGLDLQQQSELYASSSRTAGESVDQQRQFGYEYGGGYAPSSYAEVGQDRRQSDTRSIDSGSKQESSKTEKRESDMRSRASSPPGGSKSAKKVRILRSDEVRYLKPHSSGSSLESESASSRKEDPQGLSNATTETGRTHAQDSRLLYDQTRAAATQDWQTSKAKERTQNRDDDTRMVRHGGGKATETSKNRYSERPGEGY